jgi:NAD+--asparagine ADP-ribosyltransferase
LDTQEECEEQKNSDSDTTAASSSSTSNAAETIKNRFGRSQDSLRPKSNNQQMLHLLKTQFEEDRKKAVFFNAKYSATTGWTEI